MIGHDGTLHIRDEAATARVLIAGDLCPIGRPESLLADSNSADSTT